MNRTLTWLGLAMVAMGWPLLTSGQPQPAPAPTCQASDVSMDVDGDGRSECVRLVRVAADAWVDVRTVDGGLRSSTRVGAWTTDSQIEAFNVDGDRRMDLVRRWTADGKHMAQAWISDGNAFDAGWIGEDPRVTGRTLAQR